MKLRISFAAIAVMSAVSSLSGQNSATERASGAGISSPPASETPPRPKAVRVVISKEDFLLTVYAAADTVIARYPVAVGENYGDKKIKGDHKTPEGTFRVQSIEDASRWTHDFGDGKGEIEGAYGSHFVRLLTPPHRGIGIHGTHDPASIGTRATEGCIRLRNEDLPEFVELVGVGMPVTITGSERDRAADGL